MIISKKLGSSILVGTLLATPLGFPLENDTALAGSPETFDFSVAGGIALGTVLVEQKDLSSQKFQIGGVPLSVTWTNDSSQNWSPLFHSGPVGHRQPSGNSPGFYNHELLPPVGGGATYRRRGIVPTDYPQQFPPFFDDLPGSHS